MLTSNNHHISNYGKKKIIKKQQMKRTLITNCRIFTKHLTLQSEKYNCNKTKTPTAIIISRARTKGGDNGNIISLLLS